MPLCLAQVQRVLQDLLDEELDEELEEEFEEEFEENSAATVIPGCFATTVAVLATRNGFKKYLFSFFCSLKP